MRNKLTEAMTLLLNKNALAKLQRTALIRVAIIAVETMAVQVLEPLLLDYYWVALNFHSISLKGNSFLHLLMIHYNQDAKQARKVLARFFENKLGHS